MKSTKWTRRHVLKGAGIALSVPWLETFAAREAKAAAIKRYLGVYFPNGTASAYWGASGAGATMALKPIVQPLQPNIAKTLVLGNVGNYSPWNGHIEPSHGHNSATAWTGVRANGPMNANSSISIDIAIANQLQAANGGKLPTPLHSLQVGLSTLKSYFDGLPEPHSRSMSWKSASEPLYNIVSPQALFDHMVAGGLPMGGNMAPPSDPLAERRRMLKQSALDYITESSTTLRTRLSKSDQMRMDEFLTSVRTLETRVVASGMPPVTGLGCSPVARPTATYGVAAVPADYNRGTHATMMIDLTVMAFQCDLTRVVSFMLDDARSDFVYNFLKERSFTATGSTPATAPVGGYHGLQHTSDSNNGFATIGYWNIERVNELVTKISAIKEGTGTAFDGMVVQAMSGMHGGNHDSLNLPIVLVGNAGGVLKTNQFIDFGTAGVPMMGGKNLQDINLTLLNSVFGGTQPQFGTAMGMFVGTTGIVKEILA